jgi:hypothetical protein
MLFLFLSKPPHNYKQQCVPKLIAMMMQRSNCDFNVGAQLWKKMMILDRNACKIGKR